MSKHNLSLAFGMCIAASVAAFAQPGTGYLFQLPGANSSSGQIFGYPYAATPLTASVNTLGPSNTSQIVAKPDFVDANRLLVADMIDGLFEGIKYTLLEPEHSIDLHIKANPELAMLDMSREFINVGQSIIQVSIYSEQSRQHGLGYSVPDELAWQAKILRETSLKDLPGQPPKPDHYLTNEFVGKVTLTPVQWDEVHGRVSRYADLVGLKV